MTTGEAPEHSSKQFVSIIQRVLACERGLLLQEGYFINNGVFAIPKFDQIRAGAIALKQFVEESEICLDDAYSFPPGRSSRIRGWMSLV